MLTTGTDIGTFATPIPLPAGEWLVVRKHEGDIAADAADAQCVKDWVYATGMSLAKVLDNSAAEFVLPKAYAARP